MSLISYVYLLYIHQMGDRGRERARETGEKESALCAKPWIIKIDPFVMLACIKLRYAMRLPLTAAMVSPCRVSLHLAAWAYLMFCQGLWCSCQEHSCSNSRPTLSLWQLLQKLYFQTNFLMPLALCFQKDHFHFVYI